MTLKTAQNTRPIYASIDDSTYQSAVCEASGRLAQEMGLPIHLFHVIDIEDDDHKKKHSDNPAERGEESIIKKLLRLEEGLATVEDEDKANLLDSLHRKMNAEYLVKVDYEQIEGDFEESLIAQHTKMGWLVMGKSGKTNEGNPEKIGEHTLNILQKTPVPALIVNTPYRAMSDVLIAVTGTPQDSDWLQRLIAHPHASDWLKDKKVHLILINSDPNHPNYQASPVIVSEEELKKNSQENAEKIAENSNPAAAVAGVEMTAVKEAGNEGVVENVIESALDKLKSLAKELTETFHEKKEEVTQSGELQGDLQNPVMATPAIMTDLPSFQQATRDWDSLIPSLHRQVIFQSDRVKVILSYISDNQINGVILPAIATPTALSTTLQNSSAPINLASSDSYLVETLLKESHANLILMP